VPPAWMRSAESRRTQCLVQVVMSFGVGLVMGGGEKCSQIPADRANRCGVVTAPGQGRKPSVAATGVSLRPSWPARLADGGVQIRLQPLRMHIVPTSHGCVSCMRYAGISGRRS